MHPSRYPSVQPECSAGVTERAAYPAQVVHFDAEPVPSGHDQRYASQTEA
jgi:hypothetical protein